MSDMPPSPMIIGTSRVPKTQTADDHGDSWRIVTGNPTDEEIAALVAVLTARAATSEGAPEPLSTPVSGWAAHWRTTNSPQPSGRDGWRTSGLPR